MQKVSTIDVKLPQHPDLHIDSFSPNIFLSSEPVPPDEEVVSQLGQYKPRKEEYIAGLGKVRRN